VRAARIIGFAAAILLVSGGPAEASPIAANTNAPVALTPPMGFNNWARFQCLPQQPLDGRDPRSYGFQDLMLDQAKAMVSTGLADVGYRTLVVDDRWMEQRAADGQLYGIAHWGSFKHPSSQPGFDRDLAGYIGSLHAMGLKGGLYNTAGTTTCQRVASGEDGHQDTDAKRYSEWSVDFLKLDNCGASDADLPALFRKMGEALGHATALSSHKILFDESAPAQYAPTDPMKYQTMEWVRDLGQMWRVAPDIRITHLGTDGRPLYDPWDFDDADQGYEEGVYQSFTDTVALSRYVSPGNWNDADQLLVGDSGLTSSEERSQVGLWSVMGAPLIISADIRKIARAPANPHNAETLATLKNRSVIAVDQDPLGAGGYRVLRDQSANDMGFDVVLKPLADGGLAVLLLNKNPVPKDYSIPLSEIGIEPRACSLGVTELWSGGSGFVDARGAIGGRIGAHDNLLYRIRPATCLEWAPAGQITSAQARFASAPLCLEVGEGAITVESCSSSAAQRWRMDKDGQVQLEIGLCLTAGDDATLTVARCVASPGQRFRYHRSGAITTSEGRCLSVAPGKVGNGGLIGQQGARVRIEPCRAFAPEQTFSAPHAGTVAA
jgi:alpha-galactosidase